MNAINVDDNVDVYTNNIRYYADEYIQNELEDPKDIYNTQCFDGMIDYIYTHLFKPKKGDKIYYNTKNSVLDTGDIYTLDNIFRELKMLCGKYKKRITLLRFCTLIGIGNDVISQWISGESRKSSDGTSSLHCQTAKNWKMQCESAAYSGLVDDNSVGCMFALKANYGYSETPQRVVIEGQQIQTLSKDQIHRIAQDAVENTTESLLDSLPD